MSRVITFIYAVLAGLSIAIGGTVFLAIDNKVIGAVFFTVGLFIIVTLGCNLFTGKVCYIFEKDREFLIGVPIIWLGNFVGAWGGAALIRLTRVAPPLIEKAASLCQAKLNDNLLSIFILAIFCNILIYIAVENFNANDHEVGKYIALFLGVPVFILCGFEHCVANMFYFSMAGMITGKSLLYLVVMSLGNSVGGWVFPVARLYKNKMLKNTVKA
ncbi:MAG: formate/nitrite transporter family protein [Oscillospiraceae bacterium]